MTMPSIVAEALSVDRGGRRVLNDVSFTVSPGEVFALLGGNGAGKSTTLLTFLGLLEPTAGDAIVLGHSAKREPAAVRERVAYLPETAALYGHLSARENLAYFLHLAGRSPNGQAIEAGLDRVGLQPAARALPLDRYSKGMRQKVAIALALLRETPVLLLDEPTSGLDPLAIDEFNELVASLADRGITVLMVTHDVYGACRVARRIGVLREGRIIGVFERGSTGGIDPEAVHRAFTGRAAA